jgi:hypothetical protein
MGQQWLLTNGGNKHYPHPDLAEKGSSLQVRILLSPPGKKPPHIMSSDSRESTGTFLKL